MNSRKYIVCNTMLGIDKEKQEKRTHCSCKSDRQGGFSQQVIRKALWGSDTDRKGHHVKGDEHSRQRDYKDKGCETCLMSLRNIKVSTAFWWIRTKGQEVESEPLPGARIWDGLQLQWVGVRVSKQQGTGAGRLRNREANGTFPEGQELHYRFASFHKWERIKTQQGANFKRL